MICPALLPCRARAHTLAVATIVAASCACPAAGQPAPVAAAPAVRQASLDRAAPNGWTQSVRFARQLARTGDQVEQTISIEMRLATSLRQGNQLIESNRTTTRTAQRRVITTTEIDAGRATAVLARYLEATRHTVASDGAHASAAAVEPAEPAAQPVQGKAYRCRREPGEDGTLIVTDAEGNIPPLNEYEIVAQNMEAVGQPNPLTEFLAGRTVAVGETIELPKDVADRLFGMGDRFGKVTRFDLTLQESRTEGGLPCAAFLARVEAASNNSSQMRLQVEGPLIVHIDTCRAVRTQLAGPIGLSETRGSYGHAYQLIGTGQLTMSIASVYRDVAR